MDLEEPDIVFEAAEELHTALFVAAGLVMNGAGREEFFDWARFALPQLVPSAFEGIDPDRHEQAAFWLGASFWNVAPLPSNHFKPVPLPKPERNSPCPCGSKRKYKQCCAGQPTLEPLPADIYWHFIPEVCGKSQINEMQARGQLPVHGIAIMANQFFLEEDDAQGIKMLEALFEGEANRISHRHEELIDLLCDAYNRHYKTDRKKRDFLQRMCQHHDKVIRGAAWQRTATWQQDKGNFEAAHHALAEAMRADPDNPTHALLELVLLVSGRQIDQAMQRAAFWYARMRRHRHEFPELVATLDLARTDPSQALQQHVRLAREEGGDRLERLLVWLRGEQPLPRYRFEAMAKPGTTAADRDPDTIDMFVDLEMDDEEAACAPGDEEEDFDDPMENAAVLEPPDPIARLEEKWREVRPADKPFSVSFEPMNPRDIWDDPLDEDWLYFLERHPQAINSLEVLDDVIALIYIHPLGETPYGPIHDCYPALQRAGLIVDKAALPAAKTLPWIISQNRPALRLLAHQIALCEQMFGEAAEAKRLMERYLRLNPSDNHGYRALLVNDHLRHGRNRQAAAICRNYPHDMLAETRYGHVLALYRLGDIEGAAQQLDSAVEHMPLVKDYLVKSRVAKPRISRERFQIGGKDQAWIYREDMRDCWAETQGCLEWLQKH